MYEYSKDVDLTEFVKALNRIAAAIEKLSEPKVMEHCGICGTMFVEGEGYKEGLCSHKCYIATV